MSSKAKVGSWLGKSGGASGEAYDEGSESDASSVVTDVEDIVDDDGANNDAPTVDYAEILPKIRPALLDRSAKRRQAFVQRYLQVTDDGEPQVTLPELTPAPPPASTPPLLLTLLQTLTAMSDMVAIDLVVGVLVRLAVRDKKVGAVIAKWTMQEVDKAVAHNTPALSLAPYIVLITNLPYSPELINSLATVTDAITARTQPTPKAQRILHKLNVRVWRLLRKLDLAELIGVLSKGTAKNAVLLGHVVGVALRTKRRDLVEANTVTSFYTTNIVSAKATPANPKALDEFLATFVSQETLISTLLPPAERMLLRSPEIALTTTADLLNACDVDISSVIPAKLVPAILSASKSANGETRQKSVVLLKAVVRRTQAPTSLTKLSSELIPKANSSAEQRAALFTMLQALPPNAALVDTLSPLIAKEANEVALNALTAALSHHLQAALTSETAVNSTNLAKELASSKITTRRAVSDAIGGAVWATKDKLSTSGGKLTTTFATPLSSNLKTASANTPANAAGFLEGYVAVALDPKPNATLLVTSPKPSFLLNPMAYSKLTTAADDIWLLRALATVVKNNTVDTSAARAIGLALIHLAFDSKHAEVRRETLETLTALAKAQPRVTAKIALEGLTAFLDNHDAQCAKRVEDDEHRDHVARDVGRFILASVAPSDDKATLEDIAADFVILAHHPELEDSAVSWITVCQHLGLDPAHLVQIHHQVILDKIWATLAVPQTSPVEEAASGTATPVPNGAKAGKGKPASGAATPVPAATTPAPASAPSSRFSAAALRTVTTLAFLDPVEFVADVLAQAQSDLDPSSLDFIGLEERGIWATPADQLYVDVLAPKKDANPNKNRKNYADEQWEQEVRDELAKKKATKPTNLSKQDKHLVAAQLSKEASVRAQISTSRARLHRGLNLVAALADSHVSAVEKQLGTLAELLLKSVFGPGAFLMDDDVATYGGAFPAFIKLSALTTQPTLARMTAAALLRSYNAPFIPSDYLDEPIGDLVTRIMHEINFAASSSPLDPPTFTLVSMLNGRIVELNGIGCDGGSEQAQEQLTLVVAIIAACVQNFADTDYPRLTTIRHLIGIIGGHPRLAKDGSAALADLGASLRDNATEAEIHELIQGTLTNVRSASLQALQPVDLTDLTYSEELFIATHDDDENNAALAENLWEDNGLDLPETYLPTLIPYLAHANAAVRAGTSAALADAAQQFPSQLHPTIALLQDLYIEKAKPLLPEYDRFGMVIPETVDRPDPWESRAAIASTFQKLAALIPEPLTILDFLIDKEALGDRNEQVRRTMLDAAVALVEIHGGKDITGLMAIFESHIAKPSTSQTADYIKEAVVILFGRLAGHLDPTDPRVPKVVDRLVEALNTPSELVQSAVADCLPALVAHAGDEVEYLVDRLFSTLTTGKSYAARRGAAYGLAGVVKGRGLVSLKEYELMDKLTEAAEDKSSYESREGASLAFETLTATLGKLFEPYIVQIIPLMLTLFGDTNNYVREATEYAAKVIMSKISGHCVKIILPTLLGGLDEKQWRTKKGSIELLGSMAFCAPRQLSLSLPTIIPHLTEVVNDSHAQVKSAANKSLKGFGQVLNNPEVKAIQSKLMKALADPTANITSALSALLKTTFEHYLDAPSLALVMPIIDRGLRQRSSETKRKSVQIVGNMASLTESRDLVPYLHELMPLIHDVLVDPVPEARATAAKSLGTLVERLGESNFPDLVNQLLQTLRSDTSGVDRQGAAQGLSEVLSGLGMERLEGLLPDVIASTSSPRAYVREGFISLLIYLPATFGHRFAPHLARIIPPILNGLADDSEFVREASMRAGKMIISNYSAKAVDLLLPELEKGMLDSSWRIRQSSISLTGELLYRVTGISGKVELEEDDAARGADNARKALLETLGAERRDRVLATLYIVRQDTVSVVRQASIHIWKALVQNTPRTTREILPVLMQLLVQLLGSTHVDQQETASRTIGELCRKNGERIIAEIVPILRTAITSDDARTKEGACLAFSDVMEAASKDAIETHEDVIISSIRDALVDENADVRAAAARTFDSMQHYLGGKAVDQTIPTLLAAMAEPGESSETALAALREVMAVRANTVFPKVLKDLTKQPITAFNARAMGSLIRVAGSALNRRVDEILNALVLTLEANPDEETKEALDEAIEALCESVEDIEGVNAFEMKLLEWAKDNNATRRATACNVFGVFCQSSDADTEDYRVGWVRTLIGLFADPVEDVVTAAWEALDHFVKTIDKDELQTLVVPVKNAIEATGVAGLPVAGFSRPKGVQSIVPILLAGVLSGTQEQRQEASNGIADLVQRTSEAAIKPYIIQLTGPLIRVISGQSISPTIKGAILNTLTVLLEEVPQLVRPFHPQLTRTFVKSASDPAALSVRKKAAAGLGELMKHQPRVDPLITELIGGVRSAEREVAPSVVEALGAVCSSAGANIGAAAKTSIVELVEEAFMAGESEPYNVAIASVVAGLAKHDAEAIRPIAETFLAAPTPPAALVSQCIRATVEGAPEAFYMLDCVEDVVRKVQTSVGSDVGVIARPARDARELLRTTAPYETDGRVAALLK